MQRGKAQTSGDPVFSYSTPVMQKSRLQTVDSSVNTHPSAYAPFTPMVPIPVPLNVAMNQPVFGYCSTVPPAVSQMNGIPVCSNAVNPANPTSRYFRDNGIHLSNSGIKRLLHANDTKVHIVADVELCTYKSRGSGNGKVYAPRRPDTQQTTGSTRRTFGPEANKRNKNDHRGWNPGQR